MSRTPHDPPHAAPRLGRAGALRVAAAAGLALAVLAAVLPALAQRQGASEATAQMRAVPGALPWSQVRIEADGRAVVVPRAQAGQLPALVTSVLASPSDEARPAAPGTLRLELAQGDDAAGVLELAGERWRWTPLREGRPARMLRADPELAAALRQEAQRFLRR